MVAELVGFRRRSVAMHAARFDTRTYIVLLLVFVKSSGLEKG